MATITHQFLPEDAVFLGVNFPEYRKINGTNFPVTGLYFTDTGTDDACFFKFIASNYGGGNLTFKCYMYMDVAIVGGLIMGSQIAATTPLDADDIEAKAFSTAVVDTLTTVPAGTPSQRVFTVDWPHTELDLLAANDLVHVRLFRDTDDTASGDAILTMLEISYSDGL